MSRLRGRCYCGAVEYSVGAEEDVVRASFCHCVECRLAHGSPMTWVVWLRERPIVEQGLEKIVEYARNKLCRVFCRDCGSRLWSVDGDGCVGAYVGSFDASDVPRSWEPTSHDFVNEAILPLDKIQDGLERRPQDDSSVVVASSSSSRRELVGRCHCGQVEFAVLADPDLALSGGSLCHCQSCRRATGAAVFQVKYLKPEAFRITKGADLVRSIVLKPGWGTDRRFCGNCGSRVYHVVQDWGDDAAKFRGAIGLLPALLSGYGGAENPLPDFCQPRIHVNFEEAIVPLDKWVDGLERW